MTPSDLHNIRLDIKELAKKIDQILNRLDSVEETNTIIEYPVLSAPAVPSIDTGTVPDKDCACMGKSPCQCDH